MKQKHWKEINKTEQHQNETKHLKEINKTEQHQTETDEYGCREMRWRRW